MKHSRMRHKSDPRMVEWSKAVKERDGYRCRYPLGCTTKDARLDPHHIAERSQRPDLKYDVDNGITLCRTHHDWIPLNRKAAIDLGLLNPETYEAAQKKSHAY